jgi:hypothetical protein
VLFVFLVQRGGGWLLLFYDGGREGRQEGLVRVQSNRHVIRPLFCTLGGLKLELPHFLLVTFPANDQQPLVILIDNIVEVLGGTEVDELLAFLNPIVAVEGIQGLRYFADVAHGGCGYGEDSEASVGGDAGVGCFADCAVDKLSGPSLVDGANHLTIYDDQIRGVIVIIDA